MTNATELFPYYRAARSAFWRTPKIARDMARRDMTEGKPAPKSHTPKSPAGPCIGAPFEIRGTKLAWCERPDAAGLRLVGYVDEISTGWGKLANHEGWYMRDDDYGGEVARGVVYLLPGRHGKTRAIAGIADPDNDGPAILALWDVQESESNGTRWGDHADAVLDAGRLADSLAKQYAEESREYDTAWQAGQRWAEIGEELSDARQDFLAARFELRDKVARRGADWLLIKRIGQDYLCGIVKRYRELKATRAELAEGDHDPFFFWPGDPKLKAAFNDGAGESVL